MNDLKRPALKQIFGGTEVKMTYGLQLDLQRYMSDPTQVISMLTSDPYLRDWVIRRALTPATKSIVEEADLIKPEDITLDPDECLALLDWCAEHVTYFLGKSASSAAHLGKNYQELLGPLMPSTTGSASSPSTTPSAGLSE